MFEVEKSVDLADLSAPGTLTYSIEVENTGTVSLTNVVPDDTLPDGTVVVLSGQTGDAAPLNTLDVGEIWVYTTTYFVDQAEIDAGLELVNAIKVTTDQAGLELSLIHI